MITITIIENKYADRINPNTKPYITILESSIFDIDCDYLTTAKSRFTIMNLEYRKSTVKDINYKRDDFVIVKETVSGRLLYFGVISSIEDDNIVCEEVLHLFNDEIVLWNHIGVNAEGDMVKVAETSYKNKRYDIQQIKFAPGSTKSLYGFAYEEEYLVKQTADYFRDIFQDTGVVLKYKQINSSGVITTEFVNTSKMDPLYFKDDWGICYDWDFSDTEISNDYINAVEVSTFQKDTKPGDKDPIWQQSVVYPYHLMKDGTVQKVAWNDTIKEEFVRPVKLGRAIRYAEEENTPDAEMMARTMLSKSQYAHEIACKLPLSNTIVPFEEIIFGRRAILSYKGKTINSIITGYSVGDDGSFEVNFGFTKSRLKKVFRY